MKQKIIISLIAAGAVLVVRYSDLDAMAANGLMAVIGLMAGLGVMIDERNAGIL